MYHLSKESTETWFQAGLRLAEHMGIKDEYLVRYARYANHHTLLDEGIVHQIYHELGFSLINDSTRTNR